jgi:hypothetical protein
MSQRLIDFQKARGKKKRKGFARDHVDGGSDSDDSFRDGLLRRRMETGGPRLLASPDQKSSSSSDDELPLSVVQHFSQATQQLTQESLADDELEQKTRAMASFSFLKSHSIYLQRIEQHLYKFYIYPAKVRFRFFIMTLGL